MRPDMIVPTLELHAFAVGQVVKLGPSAGMHLQNSLSYEILATLPERGGVYQYRVKSPSESFARMVSEDDIVDVDARGDA